jgi:NDP-sugar pyrophosphorylase family protein
MQAIVLAGGQGTRLRPYTTVLPKPLVPVGELPICEIVVRQLRAFGFTRIVFAVNHLAELIQAFFGDGGRWGLEISYAREEQPLGTAGPIGMVEPLDDEFLVMNGDILTDLDFRDLVRAHRASQAAVTLCATRKDVPVSLGVIEVSEGDRLVGYVEKPTLHYRVSMGIYMMSRSVRDHVPRGRRLDLPDLLKTLIARGDHVHCHPFAGEWFDIGRPEDYDEAVKRFEEKPARFLPSETPAAP